jgi:hypothetical protein
MLRIDAYKPDPRLAPVQTGFGVQLTAEQADTLRRIIDAGPTKHRIPVDVI